MSDANRRSPVLYALCGLPFAGKSTLARELARELGIARVELDAINSERGLGLDGAAITPAQWDATYAEAFRRLALGLRAGDDVIFDAVSFTRAQRDELRALAAKAGASVRIVWVDVPAEIAIARWQRNRATGERYVVRDDDFAHVLAAFEPPGEDERLLRYDGAVSPEVWVRTGVETSEIGEPITQDLQSVPVLLVTGPVGVGKTTVAAMIGELLEAARVPHAVVDIDTLRWSYPSPPDDRFRERLALANLAAIWPNFQAAGAERLVLADVLERRDDLTRYETAVPGARITVVRLHASLPALRERVAQRELGAGREWHLLRAEELAAQMERNAVEDVLVETEGRAVTAVARKVLERVGWPLPPPTR